MKKIITLVFMLLFVAACTIQSTEGDTEKFESTNIGWYDGQMVSRFIDTDYNTLCYVSDGGNRGGISCVPLQSVGN